MYLDEKELELALELAAREDASLSYIVRAGLRLLLGLPIAPSLRPPAYTDEELEPLRRVVHG